MESSESYAAQAVRWLGPEPQRGLGFALLAAAASVQEVGIVALRPTTTGIIVGNREAIEEELARSHEILRGNRRVEEPAAGAGQPGDLLAGHPVPPGATLHDPTDDRLWRDDGKCAVRSCPQRRTADRKTISDGGLIPDALFRLLLDMVMVSDPPPWAASMDEQVKHWLDEEAEARGFDGGWVVAYHEFRVGA